MDDDNSGESYDPSGGSEILERCDDCYKISRAFIHFTSFQIRALFGQSNGNQWLRLKYQFESYMNENR